MSKRLRSNKKKHVELKLTPIQQGLLDVTKKLIKENPELGPLRTLREQTFNIENQYQIDDNEAIRQTFNTIRNNIELVFASLRNRNLTPQVINVLKQETHRTLYDLQREGVIRDFQHDFNVIVDPDNPSIVDIEFKMTPLLSLGNITGTISINKEDNYE